MSGDRICITAGGVVHDMRCDGTEEHGVDDVTEMVWVDGGARIGPGLDVWKSSFRLLRRRNRACTHWSPCGKDSYPALPSRLFSLDPPI